METDKFDLNVCRCTHPFCLHHHLISMKGGALKPASNDFGCVCEQIWREQCRLKAYIAINRTKWYCFRICIKLVLTMTKLTSLWHLSERLSLVKCYQRADHYIPTIFFHFIRWRFHSIRGRYHYSNCFNGIKMMWHKTTFNLKLIIGTCT